jgi:hypothetical protein
MLHERFDAPTVATFHRALVQPGQVLATLLAEVLAGKHPPELAALLAGKPQMRAEEVLRLVTPR